MLPMPYSLTHSQRKDRATQLLIKYKSGALVTQFEFIGAEANDCVQFPDNQPKFQVIELDRPSWPPDIEMSEEKIICLIAPAARPSIAASSSSS